MKKLLAIILALVMCFGMAACANAGSQTSGNGDGPSGTVTVYTSVPQEVADTFNTTF